MRIRALLGSLLKESNNTGAEYYFDYNTTVYDLEPLVEFVLQHGTPSFGSEKVDGDFYDDIILYPSDYNIRVYYRPSWSDIYYQANTIFTSHDGSFTKPFMFGIEDFDFESKIIAVYCSDLRDAENFSISELESYALSKLVYLGNDEFTIYYEDWMTWEDWCDSEYNTFGWMCDVVSGKPKCVVLSNDPVAYVPDWLATRYISNSTSEPIVMVEDLGWG